MIWLLLGCWIGPEERAEWAARHAPDESPADTAVEADTDTDDPGLVGPYSLQLTSADASIIGLQEGARVGASVAMGDVDGDGRSDLLVGAPLAGRADAAGAGVIYGFTHPVSESAPITAGDFFFGAGVAWARIGTSVAAGGDLDGDGYGDVVIGAPGVPAVWVVLGPPLGAADPDTADSVLGGPPGSEAGAAVALLGHCDEDGLADVVIGAPGADRAYVVYGAPPPNAELGPVHGMLRGEVDGDRAGASVAGPGDVDGDGLDDVLIGAPVHAEGSFTAAGAVYLLHGPPAADLPLGEADAVLTGNRSDGAAGTSVSGAGDVDGDGLADVLVGGADGFWLVVAPGDGRASLATAQASYGNDTRAERVTVAGAGDLDGDGRADLAMGASGRDDDRGAVWFLYGSVEGVLEVDDVAISLNGLEAGDELGFAFARAPGSETALLLGAPGRAGGRGAAYLFLDVAR